MKFAQAVGILHLFSLSFSSFSLPYFDLFMKKHLQV
jgi:hypothetical protein